MARTMRLEVAERGEGHQTPEVFLHKSEARAVEDSDDGERDEKRRDGAGLRGEESHVEANHGVEAELSGNDHGERDRELRCRCRRASRGAGRREP